MVGRGKKTKNRSLAESRKNAFKFKKLLGGGLEPPCLAACAPQTHVSAISPPELDVRCYPTDSAFACKPDFWDFDTHAISSPFFSGGFGIGDFFHWSGCGAIRCAAFEFRYLIAEECGPLVFKARRGFGHILLEFTDELSRVK